MAKHIDTDETSYRRPDWGELVLVCGKCQRKRDRPSFRDDLRKRLKSAHPGDRFRVVETTCLDICSKDGISVMRSRDLVADQPMVRVAGPDEDADDVVRWLLE